MRLTDLEMDVLRSERGEGEGGEGGKGRGRERGGVGGGEGKRRGEGERMEYMVISVKHLYCKRWPLKDYLPQE